MAIKLSGSTIIDDSRNIVNAGIVTATSFDGDGSGLSGIVTSITAGTGISIDQSTGQVTIASSITQYSDTDVDTHLNVSGASSGQILSWNGTDYAWVADQSGSGGSSSFTGLNDTPGSLGTAGQVVVVNSGATALEFVTPYGDTDVSSHLNTSSASTNQVLSWNGTDFAWVAQSSGGGGIALTDLSVGADGTASGSGSLSYNNTTGVFTYTPPDLSSYLTSYTVTASDLSGISIDALSDVDTSSTAPTDGQALLWNNTNSKWEPGTVSSGGGGTTTFLGLTDTPGSFTASKYLAVNSGGTAIEFVDAPSGGSGGIALTDLSITTAGTASGGGSLSYDNTTGVFTFTPADTSGGGGGGATAFTGLSDTPASMGTAGQYLAVNSGGTALEFVAAPSGGGGGTSLTVQTRNGSSGAEGNEATAISKITFNSASGFSVSEPNEGEAFISLGSAFAPWSVDGQTTLTPEGEEEVEFIAGDGITITTNNTSSPKSITFTASGGGGGGGGGASTLGDLTDVDFSTAPTAGKVLKYNGTSWVPSTDSTGSGGGGGGGGDGSAYLGENSRLSYDGGLLTLTTTTQINDAIDSLNQIMVKLAPPTPPPLSTKTMSISGSYAAIKSGTHEALSTVVDSLQPTTANITNFYDGATGTLTFTVDGTQDGQIALSTGVGSDGNAGTDGGLTIVSDTDPYAGEQGRELFWEQLTARVQSTSALTAGSTVNYTLTHSSTGSASLDFFIDQPNTGASLSVSGESVDTSAATAAKGFISGVPTFTNGSTVAVSCTVNGAVTKAYNSTKVCTMSGSVVNTQNVPPEADTYNEGDAITLSAIDVTIGNNKFSDGDFTISLKGVNSKGTQGDPTSLTVPGRVDTKSDETLRKTSGSGLYPASGFGDTYDSTQSLASNEELQMKNGKFEYPSVDYSSNALAGPNYSSLSGTRWVTFRVNGPANKGGGTLTITATGLEATSSFDSWQASDNVGVIKILFKIDGAGHWMDANAAFSPGTPSSDGVAVCNAGTSQPKTKVMAFPDYYTGSDAYVRIGLDAGSNATITNVSVSY